MLFSIKYPIHNWYSPTDISCFDEKQQDEKSNYSGQI